MTFANGDPRESGEEITPGAPASRRVTRPDVAEFILDQLEADTCLRNAPGVSGSDFRSARPPRK